MRDRVEKDESGNKTSSLVLKYEIKARVWREIFRLSTDIHQTTDYQWSKGFCVRRIGCRGTKTDLVHGMDTLSCCVYKAGRLLYLHVGHVPSAMGKINYYPDDRWQSGGDVGRLPHVGEK